MALNDTLGVKYKADTSGLDEIEKKSKKTGKSLKDSGDKGAKSFSRLDKVLGNVSKQLSRQAKRIAVGAVAGIGGLGAIALKTSIDFEDSFAGVRKTVNATEAEFAQLSQGFRNMAKEIPVNVNELNRIGESAGQLGIKTGNIEDFVEVIAKLGVTTNLTTEEASTQLARFANITGLAQDQFGNLASALVDLGNNFATTEAEISEMALRLAGAGSQIGLSEQEILAFATSLSSVGLKAESAGTSFSKLFIGIAGAVDKGGADLQTFANIAGQTSEEFRVAFQENASQAILDFVEGLGNAEQAGTTTLALLEELGIEEVRFRDSLLRASKANELFADAQERSNKAYEEGTALNIEASKRFETTASKLKLLKQNIQDVFITIGNGLKPAIDALIPVVQDMAQDVGKWIDENDELIKQDVLKLVNDLKEAMPALVELFKGATTAVRGFAQGISWLKEKSQELGDFVNNHDVIFVGGFPVLKKNANIGMDETDAVLKQQQETNAQIDALIEANEALAKSKRQQATQSTEEVIYWNDLDVAMAQNNNTLFTMNKAIDETTDKKDEIQKTGDELKNIIVPKGGAGAGGSGGGKDTKTALEELNEAIEQQIVTLKEEVLMLGKTEKEQRKLKSALELSAGATKALVKERDKLLNLKADTEFLENLDEEIEKLKDQKRELTATTEELRNFAIGQQIVNAVLETTSEEALVKAIEKIKEYKELLEDIDLIEFTQEFAPDAFEELEKGFGLIREEAEKTESSLDDFIGNVAGSINEKLGEALFNLSEGFESLGDLVKGVFDDIKRSFFDLLATFITNPIRIGLDKVFGGGSAQPGQEGQGLLDLFGGGLGGGVANFLSAIGVIAQSSIPLAGTIINAVLTVATVAIGVIQSLLKKKPRLDIDFDRFRDTAGKAIEGVEGIVNLGDFLDDELANQIIGISVKRKAGLGVGGDEGIKKILRERIQQVIGDVQNILKKLPKELSDQLNDLLLNATLDTETVISGGGKGERFFEFDAEGKGKKVAEAFKTFIEDELPAKMFGAIRESFFQPALEALGVSSEATQSLIDQFLEDLEGAGSREARGEIGKEFIENFNAFVDAFNIVNRNFADSSTKAINDIKNLSEELGFEGIPNLEELRLKLAELIETADLDAEIVQKYQALRQAIIGMVTALAQGIQNIVAQIQGLNQTFGFGIDTTDQVRSARDKLITFFNENEANLSPQEKQALLQEIQNLNNILAQADLASGGQDNADQSNAERARIQGMIDQQRELRDLTQETFDAQIDKLEAELAGVQILERLNEQLLQDRTNMLLSNDSPLTGTEQLGFINSELSKLEGQLLSAETPQEQEGLINQIRALQNEALSIMGEVFGVGSAEQIAKFEENLARLDELIALTDVSGRSSEQIQLEIEALNRERNEQLAIIDQTIERLNEQLSAIGTTQVQATGQISQDVIDVGQMLADEWLRLLDQQLEHLDEIVGDPQLMMVDLTEELLITARDHRLKTVEGFNTLIRALRPGKADNGAQLEYRHGGVIGNEVRGLGSDGRSYTFGEGGAEVVIGLEELAKLRGSIASARFGVESLLGTGKLRGGSGGTLNERIEIVLRFDGDFDEMTKAWVEREIQEGTLGRAIIRRVETGLNRKKVA